jgi:aryl-alcohol dehydrogenase-like predicted oxidoreductase
MMPYRTLGRTGIHVSTISFGGGPVSGWAASDDVDQQLAVVQRAIDAGINWFDTAPTYADGRSELALGNSLTELAAHDRVHLATKVRLTNDALDDIPGFVLRSMESSLARMRCARVTLLQLHNSITPHRGDEPTSVTPDDVIGPRGVLAGFELLRAAGVVKYFGLTGLGDPGSLQTVMETNQFDTVQTPFNLLNPSAGQAVGASFTETNYGNQFEHCTRHEMGVFAIRVFAGGALLQREPSAHTKITKFFPLDLYQRDLVRAQELEQTRPAERALSGDAIRFALAHPAVTSALIGFANRKEVDEAVAQVVSMTSMIA